jgi:hypothetical protein
VIGIYIYIYVCVRVCVARGCIAAAKERGTAPGNSRERPAGVSVGTDVRHNWINSRDAALLPGQFNCPHCHTQSARYPRGI